MDTQNRNNKYLSEQKKTKTDVENLKCQCDNNKKKQQP